MPTKFKKCRRYNDPGHAHELTFSCFKGQPFLSHDRARQWLSEAIELACHKHSCDVWAYVFMPEHVHLLLWPNVPDYSISKILATIKQSVSRRAIGYVSQHAPEFLSRMEDIQPNGKRHFRFWQRGGGYDRNVTEPKTIWAQIDYIHANPVRRKLCSRPHDWYWSSAADYAGIRKGPVQLNPDSLPRTLRG
jgi:putative transposase